MHGQAVFDLRRCCGIAGRLPHHGVRMGTALPGLSGDADLQASACDSAEPVGCVVRQARGGWIMGTKQNVLRGSGRRITIIFPVVLYPSLDGVSRLGFFLVRIPAQQPVCGHTQGVGQGDQSRHRRPNFPMFNVVHALSSNPNRQRQTVRRQAHCFPLLANALAQKNFFQTHDFPLTVR